MLKLKNVVKTYAVGGTSVQALRGVDLEFRENEFVCILGPSGCGKTTLLNIIGGLDQYTSGDLVINGVSTRNYRDAEWDAYRNHSVGFVFQTYNLIPHQSVLANVELALTLSGVSKSERTERAKTALEQVGLGDQLRKKPNQLSGGQMQRVAIARALVNNPDILLADEPTGALDSETSVQVMELLKEISRDRLVIMVTHNPDLANRYSTRIVRLLDGLVTSDSSPENTEGDAPSTVEKKKKPSMSFVTALSLSLNNLLTKKTRTFLTAFAGSIGIIGIALILSLSSGLQAYISRVEKDTLSSYPITIEHEAVDLSSLIQSLTGNTEREEDRAPDRIYTNNVLGDMLNSAVASVSINDLSAFKDYVDANRETLDPLVTAISFGYGIEPHLYSTNTDEGIARANPNVIMNDLMGAGGSDSGGGGMNAMGGGSFTMSTGRNTWSELIDNRKFLESQYVLLDGKWPESYNEVVLIVNEHSEITDIMLYSLGLSGPSDMKRLRESMINGTAIEQEARSFSYQEILDLSFALVLPADYYVKSGGEWKDMSNDDIHMTSVIEKADKINIVGILKPNEDAVAVATDMTVGYLDTLSRRVMEKTNESQIVKEQLANEEVDVFSGKAFDGSDRPSYTTLEEIFAYLGQLPVEESAPAMEGLEQMQSSGTMSEEQIVAMFNRSLSSSKPDATLEGNLELLGVADESHPETISFYASSFENKEAVLDFIAKYNDSVGDDQKLSYTDYVGLLMSSVTTVINAISYVLIAFVSISLVVSSIMIGIITYISVLERTKEIGILRSIGASKRDVSRVFNAETLIIGFVAGAIGIIITLLLCIPANAIIYSLTNIKDVAALPLTGGVVLVLISMALSFIAGLIPSRVAANKDPVVALRTE